MEDVQNFLHTRNDDPEITVVPTTATKKRKKEIPANKEAEREQLRKKARFHCACPEQWKSVSRYSNQRLTEFIENKEYEMDKSMQGSVFDFLHKTLALVLDRGGKGGGYIQEQILSDDVLRKAIEYEGCQFIKYLNNKMKILCLSIADVAEGKRTQMKNTKHITINGAQTAADENCTETEVVFTEDFIVPIDE